MELQELQRNWNALGERDPLWAILTRSKPWSPEESWDQTEFLTTGERYVADLLRRLEELGLSTGANFLDFGCGVGRLTQALAPHFDSGCGVDIAPAMIKRAIEINRYGERIRYVLNSRGDLGQFDDAAFDLVCTVIVLQHMEPDIAKGYLRDFFRVCSPGGTVVFQIPEAEKRIPLPAAAFSASISAEAPPVMIAGGGQIVSVHVRNTSPLTWDDGAEVAIRCGNHWLDSAGTVVHPEDGRVALPHDVGAGESVRIALTVTAPTDPGRYLLEVDLVQEGYGWFAQHGSSAPVCAVEVIPAATPRWRRLLRRSAAGTKGSEFEPKMEMYGIPRADVVALIEGCGATVVAVDPDHNVGGWTSSTYYARNGVVLADEFAGPDPNVAVGTLVAPVG